MDIIELSLLAINVPCSGVWAGGGQSVLRVLIKAQKRLIITQSLLVLKGILFILCGSAVLIDYSSLWPIIFPFTQTTSDSFLGTLRIMIILVEKCDKEIT